MVIPRIGLDTVLGIFTVYFVLFFFISAIKLTQIEKYRMRLKERDRRKQLARQYGLITAAAQSAAAAAIAASTPGPKPSKSPYTKKRGSKEDRYGTLSLLVYKFCMWPFDFWFYLRPLVVNFMLHFQRNVRKNGYNSY